MEKGKVAGLQEPVLTFSMLSRTADPCSTPLSQAWVHSIQAKLFKWCAGKQRWNQAAGTHEGLVSGPSLPADNSTWCVISSTATPELGPLWMVLSKHRLPAAASQSPCPKPAQKEMPRHWLTAEPCPKPCLGANVCHL